MTSIRVESNDPRLAVFRERDRQLASAQCHPEAPGGLFIAEGDLVVERALDAGYEPVALLCDDRKPLGVLDRLDASIPIYRASAAERVTATGLGVALDVLGLFLRRPTPEVHEVLGAARRIVGFEAVDNPTNLGSIARSALALGADALVLDATSADPFARRAVRASMGATLRLPAVRFDDWATGLQALGDAGHRLFALTPSAAARSIDLIERDGRPCTVLLGAERVGLSPDTLARCEQVRIPMADGVDSLNVAAAAAIACHRLFAPS